MEQPFKLLSFSLDMLLYVLWCGNLYLSLPIYAVSPNEYNWSGPEGTKRTALNALQPWFIIILIVLKFLNILGKNLHAI